MEPEILLKEEKKNLTTLYLSFLRNHWLFLLVFCFLFISSLFISTLSPAPVQTHFVDLAGSFLKGHLYIVDPSRLFDDTAVFNNRTYIYYNPLPALLLMPFVFIFGNGFHQEYLMPFFTIINFILLYKIGIKMGIKTESESLWIALSITFGSIYLLLAVTTITSYYVQVIGFTFLLLAVYEYLTNKRWWLIGTFVALAGASRITLLLGIIFFIIELLKQHLTLRHKIPQLVDLLLPILIVVVCLGEYNYMRFGKITETGYSYQINQNPIYTIAKAKGLFSFTHIPGNLYFFLFKGPDSVRQDDVSYMLKPPYLRVNEWGLGLMFTSPLFLYLILIRKNQKYLLSSLVTIFFMFIPMLMYFGIGTWQYGYRYGLDFYPFLLLLLLPVFRDGIPLLGKILIVYSIIFTMLYMYSIWNIYPLMFLWNLIPY